MTEPIQYAYHVTNVPYVYGTKHPDWESLRRTIPNDYNYDGPLVGLPCIFFTTSLYRHYDVFGLPTIRLPTISPYPTNGIQGKHYWRLNIPIERFNNYQQFWRCNNVQEEQVRLILTRRSVDDDIIKLLRHHNEITEIQPHDNSFLQRSAENEWQSNIYGKVPKYGEPFLTNFVVLDETFDIPDDAVWDGVKRSKAGPGTPTDTLEVVKKLWKENVRLRFGNNEVNEAANLFEGMNINKQNA